ELMRRVRECCARNGRSWSASDLLTEMRKRAAKWPTKGDGEFEDARGVVDRVVADALAATRHPPADITLAGVGVTKKAGKIVISNDPPLAAAIRAYIFSSP